MEVSAMRKMRNTPWDRNKANEIYAQKLDEPTYSINKVIDRISFSDKYLSI